MDSVEPQDKDELIAWLRERVARLEQQAAHFEQQAAHFEQQASRFEERNKLLEQKVDYLIRQLYGGKSEKLDPGQLELLLGGGEEKKPEAAAVGPDPEAEAQAKGATRARSKREQRMRRSMDQLPREVETIVPPEVQQDPGNFERVGEEVGERLEVEPARYWVRRTVRPTYKEKTRDADAEPRLLCAPLPPALLEGSVLSASLAADILDKKYCQHLPFYRQEQLLKLAHGLDIRRDMLCRWHEVAAEWLQPLYNHLITDLRAGGYVQADESPVDYQAPGTGKTARGYFWVYRSPRDGLVVYDWHEGRGHQCLDRVLGGFAGIVQTDGYRAYDAWSRHGAGKVRLVSCLAHIRRKFEAALGDRPKLAGWLLRQIGHLYALEKETRESRAGPDLRLALRQARSVPIMRRLHRAMVQMRSRHSVLPTSLLGKALDYALAEWDGLSPCLEDGRVELDNNGVENAIRPLKLGAKNWLFIGREHTGWRTAVVLTLVENVRQMGLSPREYLKWVFERLPGMTNKNDLRALLPKAWAATLRRPAKRAA